jgi:hypothetical protein
MTTASAIRVITGSCTRKGPMPIYVEGSPSRTFLEFVRNVQAAQAPDSAITRKMEADMESIVLRDHERMMVSGIDRTGGARAPLAASTLANKRRGPGPSLIPLWTASRFFTNVEVLWINRGSRTLVKRFADIVNDQGQSFAQYHLEGATKPGTNWVLPKRDVGGLSPRGLEEVRTRFTAFSAEILNGARQATAAKQTIGGRIAGFFGRLFGR